MVLHTHHILPRHAGGTDHPSNLYKLTPTQHALAHRNRAILCNSPKDWLAWKAMSGQIPYAEATVEAVRRAHLGTKHTPEHIAKIVAKTRGKKRSAASRAKYSESKLGEKNPRFGQPGTMLGKRHKPETIAKFKARTYSAATRAKMSASAKARQDRERLHG